MRALQLHLVRHGQSSWNVEGRLQGQTAHPELTDLGRAQSAAAADLLAERIAGTGTVAVVSSDLVRARQTAAVIAAALGVAVANDRDLREQSLGELEGRLTSELTAEGVPDGLHVSEVRWGGGESLADVHRRLASPIARAHGAPHDHVVWVTHGDTMRVALARLEGRTHREVEWVPITNGAVVTVTVPRA
ncbi:MULTISPECIES: histidine phosphatase family protein [unclassified Knoellia]|uniref:histidine phosphatase family protein n=1 Tax=Knoellia altitudinis TaxID=3404795 RepID=UPI00360F4A6F